MRRLSVMVKIDIDDEGFNLPDDISAANAAKERLSPFTTEKLPNGNHMAVSMTILNAEGVEIDVARLISDGLKPRSPERGR